MLPQQWAANEICLTDQAIDHHGLIPADFPDYLL